MVPSPPVSAPAAARKRLASSPVKLACLSCRASRSRCDGLHPCTSCKSRTRECVYQPSRRGGARVKKRPSGPRPGGDATGRSDTCMAMPVDSVPPPPIDLQTFVDPGAGLKQLPDLSEDSDFIFDALFTPVTPDDFGGDLTYEDDFNFFQLPVPIVRTYKSEQSILDAYYIFIHPFFPILPPPTATPTDQAVPHFQSQDSGFVDEFEPSTPISLAISAILALIPCANDTNHRAEESILFRRKYSQDLAQCAVESIEIESEIPDSSVEPPKALNGTPSSNYRRRFHPDVPLELESIIALDILSVYEYAQRGNLKKMQSRAGQALIAAMALSLHSCVDDDEFVEAKSRVWWMTYVCVCQGAIVSSTEPTFSVFALSFTCRYPMLRSDCEAFGFFIQSQQAILAATQFVVELNKTVRARGDMTRIYQRMQELDLHLESLNNIALSWTLRSTPTSPLDPGEEVVSRALRCMSRIKINSARIKIHRYCAFVDTPVFSAKHCDLQSKSDEGESTTEPRSSPSCACSSLFTNPSPMTSATNSLPSPSTVAGTASPISENGSRSRLNNPMFSSHQSAKICLKSALNISKAFDDMPYPNPTGQLSCPPPCHLSPTSTIVCPRTMPSFACCAMQCAYALLMVDKRTRAKYTADDLMDPMVESLLVRLRAGLSSISATLANYATAFEALGGMRDQIQSILQPTKNPDT